MPDDPQEQNLLGTLLGKAESIGAQPPGLLKRAGRSVIEKLISTLGGNQVVSSLLGSDPMEPDDSEYLHQFMNPEQNILPPQNLRPELMKAKNIPFRTLGPLSHPEQYDIFEDTLPGGEVGNQPQIKETFPLGHYKQSIGQDPETGKPYLSIYDEWDFDSPVIGSAIGKMLNKTGTPYAVYDRYPLEKAGNVGVSGLQHYKMLPREE